MRILICSEGKEVSISLPVSPWERFLRKRLYGKPLPQSVARSGPISIHRLTKGPGTVEGKAEIKMSVRRKEQEVLLTRRQKKVLQLVGEANTNKEIAAAMGISPATVKRHVENILRKLQLKNRIEAALYAVGLDSCPLAIRPANCPLGLKVVPQRELAA